MIKIDLVKLGAKGAKFSLAAFVSVFVFFLLFGKNAGEHSMVYLIYCGIALVLFKVVFIISIIMLLIGLHADRKEK